MTSEVKEFIEDNIDLIEAKAWDQVYDNADFNLDSESTGSFTVHMLKAGFDPIREAHLDYVPNYYLSDISLISTTIPEGVHLLGEGCYSYTSLQEVIIPESVEELGDYVFYECSHLKKVTVLGEIRSTGTQVFYNCHNDLVIYCKKGSLMEEYATNSGIHVENI